MLKGTIHLSLNLPPMADKSNYLNFYSNAKWGSKLHDRKSQSQSICFWKFFQLIWSSQKQKLVLMSSTKSEMNTLTNCIQENQCLFHLIKELWGLSPDPSVFHIDKKGFLEKILHFVSNARNQALRHQDKIHLQASQTKSHLCQTHQLVRNDCWFTLKSLQLPILFEVTKAMFSPLIAYSFAQILFLTKYLGFLKLITIYYNLTRSYSSFLASPPHKVPVIKLSQPETSFLFYRPSVQLLPFPSYLPPQLPFYWLLLLNHFPTSPLSILTQLLPSASPSFLIFLFFLFFHFYFVLFLIKSNLYSNQSTPTPHDQPTPAPTWLSLNKRLLCSSPHIWWEKTCFVFFCPYSFPSSSLLACSLQSYPPE